MTVEVNTRWRGMVSIESGGPPISSPSDLAPLDAAVQLRNGLERGIGLIREAYGLVGENLPPDQFISLADKVWEKKGSAWDDGDPPERMWPPTADPNEGICYALMKSWDGHFFEQQRGNAARMVSALLQAAETNQKAAPPAYDLVKRLREATIVPGLDDLWNLLGDVIEFLRECSRRMGPL